jgi:hypothetical protein
MPPAASASASTAHTSKRVKLNDAPSENKDEEEDTGEDDYDAEIEEEDDDEVAVRANTSGADDSGLKVFIPVIVEVNEDMDSTNARQLGAFTSEMFAVRTLLTHCCEESVFDDVEIWATDHNKKFSSEDSDVAKKYVVEKLMQFYVDNRETRDCDDILEEILRNYHNDGLDGCHFEELRVDSFPLNTTTDVLDPSVLM